MKAELARRAGLSKGAISNYERGRVPRADILPRLAAALEPRAGGSRLRGLRRRHGLTQRELARLAGLSGYTVHRIERGRTPAAATARKLARVLGPEALDLLPVRPRGRPQAVRLREAREARGLSQRELAVRAGLSRVTVNRLEMGRLTPRRGTLARLAEALGLSPSDLVADRAAEAGGTGEP
jgi:transcriptional regulator with XRE-family HTH domain